MHGFANAVSTKYKSDNWDQVGHVNRLSGTEWLRFGAVYCTHTGNSYQ